MTRYRFPDWLGGGEHETVGDCGNPKDATFSRDGERFCLPLSLLTEVFPTPPEPEPGAYLIGDVLCVCFATDNGDEWTAASPDGDGDTNVERFDWANLWERVGGPGVQIVRLVPVLSVPDSVPDLPWSASPLRVVNAIHADLIVQHRLGHVLTTFGAQFAALSPDMADAMAAALLAAARAAREASL